MAFGNAVWAVHKRAGLLVCTSYTDSPYSRKALHNNGRSICHMYRCSICTSCM